MEVANQNVGAELRYLGEIPDDDAVMQHRLGQLPLIATEPKAPTSLAVTALVARLIQFCGDLRPRQVKGASVALSHNIGGHPTACGIAILARD